MDAIADPVLVVSGREDVLFRNDAATALLGDGPLPQGLAEASAGAAPETLTVFGADGWPSVFTCAVCPEADGSARISLHDVTVERCRRTAVGLAEAYGPLMDADPAAILMVDGLGRFVYANAACASLLGYAPAELVGLRMTAVFPNTRWPGIDNFLRTATRLIREVPGAVRQDGSTVRLDAELTRLEAGADRFVVISLRSGAAPLWGLAGSSAELRLLVESATHHGIFLLGADGRILSWNVGAEGILGYSPGEILGRPYEVLYTAEDRAAGVPARNLALAAEAGVAKVEGWRARKDGGRFWAEVVLTALRDEQGALRGFAEIVVDCTDRLLAEDLRRELDAATLRARFIRTAAHELRNPLAAVKGTVHLLTRRVHAGRELGSQVDTLTVLAREVDRLGRLVDEILDVARIQDGAGGKGPAHFNLVQVIADTCGGMEAAMLEVPAGESLRVAGQAARMRDVFRHLLSNARKFAAPGGPVRIRVERRGSMAAVSVADEGIGIPACELGRVFEGFSRGSNLEGRDPGGLGLGLYMCREIVRAHGGRIWAERAKGRGTIIHLELPLIGVDGDGAPAAD